MQPMQPVESEDIHLRDYLKVILKRKRIILVFFITTVVVVLLATLQSTPLYTATTRLKVEQKNGDPLNDVYRYIRHDPEFLNSQIQIISSQTVMERVVDLLDLEDTYSRYFPDQDKKSPVIDFFKNLLKGSEETAAENDATGPRPMSPVLKKPIVI